MNLKQLALAGIVALSVSLTSCGPTQKDAIKYNDALVDLSDKINKQSDNMVDQLDGHNIDSLNIVHKNFQVTIKEALAECEKMEPLDGKRYYLDAALNYFRTMQRIAEKEGSEMVMLLNKTKDAELTEEEVDKLMKSAQSYDDESEKAWTKMKGAQRMFSKEWDFELI